MQFRYKVENFKEVRPYGVSVEGKSIEDQLNAMGSLGWELIGYSSIESVDLDTICGACETFMNGCVFKMKMEYR